MKKSLVSILAALLVLAGMCMAAAAHEVPDLSENGSITLLLAWNGEALEGGTLSLYRVGDIREDDGNYSFVPVSALQDSGLSLEQPDDPALAQALARRTGALEGVTVPVREGRAFFADVTPGLYLVVQEKASEGFEPMNPFLISMPRYEDGVYVTHVTARPKVDLETAPTEPPETTPTEPVPPELPQTGQLNWPVPLLAAVGLGFFALGWALCFGGKRRTEK